MKQKSSTRDPDIGESPDDQITIRYSLTSLELAMRRNLVTVSIVLFMSWSSGRVTATHQELDRVTIDGAKYHFIETPMSWYWNDTQPMRKFDPNSTANWKGYMATWEIREQKLLLTSFVALINGKPFDVVKMIGMPLPAEATWLCGALHAVNNGSNDIRDFTPINAANMTWTAGTRSFSGQQVALSMPSARRLMFKLTGRFEASKEIVRDL